MPGDQPILGALEQLAPLRVDGLRRGEIPVEEIPDVAEVDVVDAFRGHCVWPPIHLSEIDRLPPPLKPDRCRDRAARSSPHLRSIPADSGTG
jgi:hypothetical protein